MAVSTISTFSVLQSTLGDVNKVESALQNEQEQLSSGNASQDFAGMSGQVQQFLSLDAVLSRTNQYLNDNKVVESRITQTNSVLTQVISTAGSLQSLISSRMSGTSNSAAFGTQLQGIWQTLVGQLNTTVDNGFLFSGTAVGTQPVNSTSFPSLRTPGVPDAGYYHGSQQDVTARPQDGTVVTYNVRADNPGFQQIFAALATAKAGDAQNDPAVLQQAETLVQNGLQDVIGAQATVQANSAQFSNIDTNLNNQKLYFQGLQQSIGNTDIVSVSTQVATNQGILQAAFQAFAKISALRLSDYLK